MSHAKSIHDNHRALAEQKSQLSESARLVELGVLAGGISHEIKNPLTVIKRITEIAITKAKKQGDESIVQSLQPVLDMTGKILKLLDGFRAMSRSDAVSLPEITNINKVLEYPLSLIEKSAQQSNVKITLNLRESDREFVCRPVQIGQVVMNLIKNGIDAIEKLEDKWIKVSFWVFDGSVNIVVTDSGFGIPEEVRNKMKINRFTSKSSDKGTGLGLSISSEICRSHNGSLEINSMSPNTEFVIKFPIVSNVDDFKPNESSDSGHESEAPSTSNTAA